MRAHAVSAEVDERFSHDLCALGAVQQVHGCHGEQSSEHALDKLACGGWAEGCESSPRRRDERCLGAPSVTRPVSASTVSVGVPQMKQRGLGFSSGVLTSTSERWLG